MVGSREVKGKEVALTVVKIVHLSFPPHLDNVQSSAQLEKRMSRYSGRHRIMGSTHRVGPRDDGFRNGYLQS